MLHGTSAFQRMLKGGSVMRHTVCNTLVILLLLGLASEAVFASDVSYRKRSVQGVSANVVVANLNCPNVRVSPALALRGVGASEGFGSMLCRLQPAAAITGTFFCTNSLIPVADLVIAGNVLNFGRVGSAICFTADNRVEFMRTREGQSTRWAGYVSVICGGPRLVRNGVPSVNPTAEGFRDPGLFRPAARSAVGVTRANKLLLVTVNRPVYLSHMARIMKDLGAVDAINLDGGSSTALYCKGSVPSHPARRLTNLVVVYDNVEKFQRRQAIFLPGVTPATKLPEASPDEAKTDSPPKQSILRWMIEQESREETGSPIPRIGLAEEKETMSEWEARISHSDPLLYMPFTNGIPENEEAAANEYGLLPHAVYEPNGLSRRTSSAWPRRTSSSYSPGTTSQPYRR